MLGGLEDSSDAGVSKGGKPSALRKHILLGPDGKAIHERTNKMTTDGAKCYREQDDEPRSQREGRLTVPRHGSPGPHWGGDAEPQEASDTRGLEAKSS